MEFNKNGGEKINLNPKVGHIRRCRGGILYSRDSNSDKKRKQFIHQTMDLLLLSRIQLEAGAAYIDYSVSWKEQG